METTRRENFEKGEIYSDKFDELFVEWINTVNLSYDAINHEKTREIFRYLGVKLKGNDFYLTAVNKKMLSKRFVEIYYCLNAFSFALYFDESTYNGINIQLNIFIQVLDNQNFHKPFLLTCLDLENKRANTLFTRIDVVLKQYLTVEKIKKNWKFLITDGEPACKCAGEMFENEYNTVHFICLAHKAHNLCESIKNCFSRAGKLMSIVNKRWQNQKLFVTKFKMHFTEVVYTPYGDTRWGTWLRSAQFFFENFEGLKILFASDQKYYAEENKCFEDSKMMFDEFEMIYFFKDIGPKIISLEKLDLTVEQQLVVYFEIGDIVRGTRFEARWSEIFEKNKNLKCLFTKNNLLRSAFTKEYKYLNLTNSNVERSFNFTKNIRQSYRANAKIEYVEKRLVNR